MERHFTMPPQEEANPLGKQWTLVGVIVAITLLGAFCLFEGTEGPGAWLVPFLSPRPQPLPQYVSTTVAPPVSAPVTPSYPAYPAAVVHPTDAAFFQQLALSRGPHPKYHIVSWPVAGVVSGTGDIPWKHLCAYSIKSIPDGYTIHAGVQPPATYYNEHGFDSWNVAFAKAGEHLDGDWAFVCYHGIHYLRGRITQDDVPNLEHHQAFQVFTGFTVTPQEKQMAGVDGLVPLTISLAQTWKQGSLGMPVADGTFVLQFPQEQHLPLDRHAWETC